MQIEFINYLNCFIMIEKLNYQSRATEVDAVSSRIRGAYKNTSLQSDPHLPNMFTTLETQTVRLSAAINRLKAESELENKDEVRDNEAQGLFYLVEGYTHHPDAEIRSAALQVKKVLDKYGLGITGENYASESALVKSLLDDLAKPNMVAALALLSGCPETVATLKTAQNDFESTRIAYEENKAEQGNYENATTIKKEVAKLINNTIVRYLRVVEQINEPMYGAFARTVATIINDNNIMVKKRSTKDPVEEA